MISNYRLDVYPLSGSRIGILYRGNIVSMSSHRMAVKDGPTIGSCLCGELDVVITPPDFEIPTNARLVPRVREDGVWKQRSLFYIFSRKVDKESNTISIVAYDAVYKAEEQYAKPGDQGMWPRTALDVMADPTNGIAIRTGTSVNDDTQALMNNAMPVRMVDYPGIIISDTGSRKYDPDGETTMRDVAGYIAGLYGGNWIIDNAGKWRLISFGSIPAETNYLVTENGDAIVMGGVRILV